MKSPVQLYLRARLPDGSYPYLKAAFASNGRLRPGFAIVRGRAVEVNNPTYYLRYRKGTVQVWEPAGSDPSLALVCLQKKTQARQNGVEEPPTNESASAEQPTMPEQSAPTQIALNDAIREYLKEMKDHRSGKTFAAYRRTLYSFGPSSDETGKSLKLGRKFSDRPLSQITRKDILDYIDFLKKRGNSPRTVRNRVDYFQFFLHHFGLPSLLTGKDLPQYTEKKIRSYSQSQLSTLFHNADQEESDLLTFFLCTGAREQEVQFTCWPDLDLDLKTYTVTEHLDLGYRPKDKEEGSVPIPDLLVDTLKARRARQPKGRLVFPGKSGKPNGHLLRTIKRLALRSGLNCGHCINKKGKSCATHPVCRQFVLHKLRKTFATTLHHQGLPAQTLQRYLRHSDLDTTIKYIADADDETIRKTINTTFSATAFAFAGGEL